MSAAPRGDRQARAAARRQGGRGGDQTLLPQEPRPDSRSRARKSIGGGQKQGGQKVPGLIPGPGPAPAKATKGHQKATIGRSKRPAAPGPGPASSQAPGQADAAGSQAAPQAVPAGSLAPGQADAAGSRPSSRPAAPAPSAPSSPATLADLLADPRNRRTHPARNLAMIEEALRAVGAARSIVIDETNEVLAGNGVLSAAAPAGISKVRIIEAGGDEIIAVRRSGLTPDQKRALALYDNRAGELAEWNLDQLREDAEGELDFSPWFSEEELRALLDLPGGGDWSAATAGLAQKDLAGFQQVSFIVTDAQLELVKHALAVAKAAGPFIETGNQNPNGNALARLCEIYVGERPDPATD